MEREKQNRSPQELNAEFGKILGALPGPTSQDFEDNFEISEEAQAVLDGLIPRDWLDDDPTGTVREIWTDLAKVEASKNRRENSLYGGILMSKFQELRPFVQGTEAFREHLPEELRLFIKIGGAWGEYLHGDDQGGIFHSESVRPIEERSYQELYQRVRWFGKGIFPDPWWKEPDYANEPAYQEMVSLGKRWKNEFVQKYGYSPLDGFGREIEFRGDGKEL